MTDTLKITLKVATIGDFPQPENTHDGKSAYAVDVIDVDNQTSIMVVRPHIESRRYIGMMKMHRQAFNAESISALLTDLLLKHQAPLCKTGLLTRLGLRGYNLTFEVRRHKAVFKDAVYVGAVTVSEHPESNRVQVDALVIDVSTMNYENSVRVTDSLTYRIPSGRPTTGSHGVIVVQLRRWYDSNTVVQYRSSSVTALVCI
ncbi:MAG: hypothetical protein ACKO0Z_27945 [Betaproteobacteria bacterium]